VALESAPRHAIACEGLGVLLLARGRLDEAARALADAHLYDPRRLRSLVHLADALRRARRFGEAAARYREAIRQRPGLARLHGCLGLALWRLRRHSEAAAAWRDAARLDPERGLWHRWHGVALDPLNPLSHRALGDTLRYARRYDEAIAAYETSIAVDPEHSAETYALRGIAYYLAGNLPLAQSSCEARPDNFRSEWCQAVVYDRLGRPGEAAAAVAKLKQLAGEAAAYQYAEIHAQRGDRKAALEWLARAMQLGDPGLVYTKTDPLLDPLRKEPPFQAIERELKFPN
jgi:tetratricopeptide (TPR) repeat protein